MGSIEPSPFRSAWWLPGAHLQTLWPTFMRRRPAIALTPERVELDDGDFLDLAWTRDNGGPVVILIHGLEGSLQSHYARPTLAALHSFGFRAVFMHLRGCSAVPNRLERSYHSGASQDLAAVISHIERAHGCTPAAAVGFSLGGNLLLKYLGELGEAAPLRAAVAVSVPFRLLDCARRLEMGVSRTYREHLMQRLRGSYRRKLRQRPMSLQVEVSRLRGFYEFDDAITAPLNGFAGADDYYARCSSRGFLPRITVPTLLLHALDDPFMFPDTIPTAAELGPGVTLELSRHGGHVGFVSGSAPWRPRYWIDRRVPGFLLQTLARTGESC
jgi:predicted alpha/beta-fold hydrolase